MTMDPSGGFTATVVGAGDPTFSDPSDGGGGQAAAPATQVQDPPASQPVVNPFVQQDDQTTTTVVREPANPATTITPELEALIQSRVSQAHSTLDKRINTLSQVVKDKDAEIERVREEGIKRARDVELNQTPEHERQRLLDAWAGEDARANLTRQQSEVRDLYKNVEGLRLLTAYGTHGITEDDILGYTGDPTDMENFVKALAFERLTDGGASARSAEAAVKNTAATVKPAGADAQQDAGSSPAAPQEPKMLTTQGIASMAANIKQSFSQGPNIPWSL